MLQANVHELTKLRYFSRVVSSMLHTQIIELLEAYISWDIFRIALLKEFEVEDVIGTSRYEFDKWVALKKPYKSALASFQDLECQFSRLLESGKRLVGVDKVLMFLRYANRNEWMKLDIVLKDDDGTSGLIENLDAVKRICQQYDNQRMHMTKEWRSTFDLEEYIEKAFRSPKEMVMINALLPLPLKNPN